ncbi:iron-containing alcohol dehydrogenase family protein [Bordetella bronchiseptica]|uniref:iron-containing alcohol dehydrogenase family protein n=1 Tax=Bordetella bronchiseptica TaxID=518 RepID=UPI0002904E73|nr:iron-containing alcohol dehydrogenase family protein [Bordetella bronchiseptica]CCN04358.1 iron-containing alcohol dehydrogenase [Bordetella bronchiseptica Bbr77]CCN16950.1 iron-containing alcohol dehydrogenase [Bordetella bronchiseptica MO211]
MPSYARYHTPEMRAFEGEGCFEALPAELDRLGCASAVIVCGRSMARDERLLALIRRPLGSRLDGICTDVRPHSPLSAVQAVARYLRSSGTQCVIAVGGGSAIVTARAASILCAEDGDAASLCTQWLADGSMRSPRLVADKMPQIVVPTTPTTAIPKAGSAMLDEASGARMALFDPKTRARSVFLHPAFTASAPLALLHSAAFNSLALAVEGLLSRTAHPLSDAALVHAAGGLYRSLAQGGALASPAERRDLIWYAIQAGQGSDHTGAGMCIPIGHAISSMFHIDNGIANAIVLPHVLRFNAPSARRGIELLASALRVDGGGTDAGVAAVARALTQLAAATAYPSRLRDAGVARERLPDIAAVAMQDWYLRNNPVRIEHPDQIEAVLRDAW